MRGLVAHRAEIAGRADQAAAEVVLPEPVDDHPRRQGIVRVGEPVGQRRAPAGRPGDRPRPRNRLAVARAQDVRESRNDLGALAAYSPRRRTVSRRRGRARLVDPASLRQPRWRRPHEPFEMSQQQPPRVPRRRIEQSGPLRRLDAAIARQGVIHQLDVAWGAFLVALGKRGRRLVVQAGGRAGATASRVGDSRAMSIERTLATCRSQACSRSWYRAALGGRGQR